MNADKHDVALAEARHAGFCAGMAVAADEAWKVAVKAFRDGDNDGARRFRQLAIWLDDPKNKLEKQL